MAGQWQSVELAQNGYRRTVVAPAQTGRDTCNRYILGVLDAKLGEFLAYETRCLKLPEPQLRSAEDLLGDVDDPVAPPVNGGLGGGLQRDRAGHSVYVSSE